MTQRIKGLLVHFEEDYRDDDVEAIKNTILMIKGITKVTMINAQYNDALNRQRVKAELRGKLFKILEE